MVGAAHLHIFSSPMPLSIASNVQDMMLQPIGMPWTRIAGDADIVRIGELGCR